MARVIATYRTQILLGRLLPDRALQKRRTARPKLRIHVITAYSKFRMHDQPAARVRLVELLDETAHKDDRELQTLALVDAHDPNRIARL